ncbi:BrnA antitoxin family protein [uncultured Tateyamaria sp.]|uniref:BrnA antitoxin family protein n=1 Tax=uncultured Tateyamaria sp. TaxID=455651 RepID=UPI00260705A4|nr:BrnA antitoxin family protein [uncultured Tateyamaria sp.]
MTRSERKPLVDADGEVREITKDDLKFARRGRPPMKEGERKERTTILLDPDVLSSLKADGRGWQTRANALLREALGLDAVHK